MSGKANASRRRRRWPAVLAIVVALVLGAGIAVARLKFNGGGLAAFIETMLNARIAGRVEIESIDWPLSQLPRIASGGMVDVEIRGLKVFDPDDDKTPIIDVPVATATIDARAAIFGRHDIILDDITIKGGHALVRQVRQPYPVHEYDTHATSLETAFYPKGGAAFRAGISAAPAQIFDLEHFDISNIDLDFEYPDGRWSAAIKGAHGSGFLTFDGRDPLAKKLYYTLAPEAPTASVTIHGEPNDLTIDLIDVDVTRLAQLPVRWPAEVMPRELDYQAHAVTPEGAGVSVDGKLIHSLTDVFGGEHALVARLDHAGKLAARLSNGLASGDDLSLEFRISGPMMAPEYEAQLRGLVLGLTLAKDKPPLDLHVDRLAASWNDATNSGYLEDTVATGAGGEVRLSATINRKPDSADLHVDIVRPIDLGPYLPAQVVRQIGGKLSGRFHAFGTAEVQRLDHLELALGRANVHGGLYRTKEGLVHADDLELRVGRTVVNRLAGVIDGNTGDVRLDFLVDSTDVGHWLRAFRQPALAERLSGRVHVEGAGADLTASAQLTAGGVPIVDRLDASLGYDHGAVSVREAQSSALGGWLRGSGKVLLGPRPRLSGVEAQGVNLKLSKLPFVGQHLTGEVDITATASGPTAMPDADVVADIKGLSIAGDSYTDTRVSAHSDHDGASLDLSLTRKAGGVLSMLAMVDRKHALSGVVDLRKLPVEALAALAGAPGLAGGQLDASLSLSGTLARPSAEGNVSVVRGWFKEAFLGSATVDIERVDDRTLRIAGSMFQGRLAVEGTVATRAPFASDLSLRVHRLELDLLAPELAQRFGARGWLSGEIHYRGNLSLANAKPARIEASLSEAVVVLDSEDGEGRANQIRLENRTPIDLAFDGKRMSLAHDVVVRGPAGDFTLSGSASADKLDFSADGKIAMSMVAPYVKRYFERVSGELAVHLEVGGSLADPALSGVVEVSGIALQPTGQDTIVSIPSGKAELQNHQVSLTGFSMVVVDEFSSEKSELSLAGGVRLDRHFTPEMWAIQIGGQLDGKMLLVVAPQVFSAGFGSADLSIALLGAGAQPDIDGTIEFSTDTPLTVVPRGARREIALTDGFIKFTDQLVELDGIRGTVDDEGDIERLDGEISLEDWRPVDIDLSLDASSLPFRIPQELDLSVNLRGVRIVGGGSSGLDVAGKIEVVDGRYVRKFNMLKETLTLRRTSEPSTPFWDSSPLLGNARLDLTVESQGFFVKNNIADIEMTGQVDVTGTPKDPRFEGAIRVEQGSFKLQGMRARFERSSGTVSFSPNYKVPDRTPTLDIKSESDYVDTTGQSHLITLSLRGTLTNLNWDLSTAGGLNRAQTLQLILAGRTPDELRQALLGDAAIGKAPGKFGDSSTATDSSFVVADQLVKDLAGDFFSLLVEDSLKNLTTLDVARIELGTGSIGMHGEKKLLPSLRLIGDLERSLIGWSWDLTGEYRFTDSVSADFQAQAKNFNDETLQDQQNGRLQLTWRKVLLP